MMVVVMVPGECRAGQSENTNKGNEKFLVHSRPAFLFERVNVRYRPRQSAPMTPPTIAAVPAAIQPSRWIVWWW